jgi:protein-S-isoprenylcysteine O-methyltransferase Ste14
LKYSIFLWAIWFAYWVVSARKRVRDTTASSVRRETLAERFTYGAFMWMGFILLFWRGPLPYGDSRLWPFSAGLLAAGYALQIAGLGFTVWARLTLGNNWSGRIATGGNQQLVTDGPYRLVRHPIYSGLILAVAGLSLVLGTSRGIIGFVLATAGFFLKIRREEASVRRHFGRAYEEYARHVPALFPNWRKAGQSQFFLACTIPW